MSKSKKEESPSSASPGDRDEPERKSRKKRKEWWEPDGDGPTKWTAPVVGYPVYKDGKIVPDEDLPKGWPKLTDEQKRNIIANTEYFSSIKPDDEADDED